MKTDPYTSPGPFGCARSTAWKMTKQIRRERSHLSPGATHDRLLSWKLEKNMNPDRVFPQSISGGSIGFQVKGDRLENWEMGPAWCSIWTHGNFIHVLLTHKVLLNYYCYVGIWILRYQYLFLLIWQIDLVNSQITTVGKLVLILCVYLTMFFI